MAPMRCRPGSESAQVHHGTSSMWQLGQCQAHSLGYSCCHCGIARHAASADGPGPWGAGTVDQGKQPLSMAARLCWILQLAARLHVTMKMYGAAWYISITECSRQEGCSSGVEHACKKKGDADEGHQRSLLLFTPRCSSLQNPLP